MLVGRIAALLSPASKHLYSTITRHKQLARCYTQGGAGGRTMLTGSLKRHLQQVVLRHNELLQKLSSPELGSSESRKEMYRAASQLEPIAKLAQDLEQTTEELRETELLLAESGTEIKTAIEEELAGFRARIALLEELLLKSLISKDTVDKNDAILEVRAGTGGMEASLFAAEIFHMYQKFASIKKWKFEALSTYTSEAGGYKNVSASLAGEGVFGVMKYEIGVHRVQRVPSTEARGRMHTSTISVAVLPQPTEVEVVINPADLKVATFRSTGAGGQHVNTTDSAVRITHLPTGIVVGVQDERSQHQNKAKALKLLRAKLYEKKRAEADTEREQQRRKQIGTAARSEKIRSYNFPQDRVTDHRLGRTMGGVERLLSGGELLEEIIADLKAAEEAKQMEDLLLRFSENSTQDA